MGLALSTSALAPGLVPSTLSEASPVSGAGVPLLYPDAAEALRRARTAGGAGSWTQPNG